MGELLHTHACMRCATIWRHREQSEEDFDKAHTCPSCGRRTTMVYNRWAKRHGINLALPRPVRMTLERFHERVQDRAERRAKRRFESALVGMKKIGYKVDVQTKQKG